jgi:hypothetical protein
MSKHTDTRVPVGTRWWLGDQTTLAFPCTESRVQRVLYLNLAQQFAPSSRGPRDDSVRSDSIVDCPHALGYRILKDIELLSVSTIAPECSTVARHI